MVSGGQKIKKGGQAHHAKIITKPPIVMKIHLHTQFQNSYQKLDSRTKKKAEKKEIIFRQNPFDQRLKTHKLHGKLKKLWSFSVDTRYRVIFEFIGRDVIFLDVGDHDLYK